MMALSPVGGNIVIGTSSKIIAVYAIFLSFTFSSTRDSDIKIKFLFYILNCIFNIICTAVSDSIFFKTILKYRSGGPVFLVEPITNNRTGYINGNSNLYKINFYARSIDSGHNNANIAYSFR